MAYEVAYYHHQQQQQQSPASPQSSSADEPQPVSRTYQYRKVMKPMLERKRRARINRCLDELKELMVAALQAEGENVAKLEKADILELTVRHLHTLRRKRRLCGGNDSNQEDRFRAGFTHAAAEVSKCLAQTPGVDVALGTKLMTHLGHRLNDMDQRQQQMTPISVDVRSASSSASSTSSSCSPLSSPAQLSSPNHCYGLPLTPACSPEPPMSPQPLDFTTTGLLKIAPQNKEEAVWRPW